MCYTCMAHAKCEAQWATYARVRNPTKDSLKPCCATERISLHYRGLAGGSIPGRHGVDFAPPTTRRA